LGFAVKAGQAIKSAGPIAHLAYLNFRTPGKCMEVCRTLNRLLAIK
jgi:hypothetical protein